MSTFCLVAGGGTAGHLVPGLVTADELVRRGHGHDEVHFVVSERPIDQQLLDATSFPWTTLPGRGIQRRLTLANLAAAWGLLRAGIQALGIMRRERPAVVLAVGGYASLACAVAAVVCRVPLVVAEQNARAGAANRVVGRFARACAVPFRSTDLPHATVTGNPVRSDVLAIDRQRDCGAARDALGLSSDRTVVLAFAGSLGSRRVNEAVLGVAEAWRDRDDVAIHHSVGSRDWDDLQPAISALADASLQYHAVPYEDRMHLAMAAADVAVCRAGGTTVAEVAVVGLPSILVPLPIAPRDHQTANARELVDAGAACLVPDGELTSRRLVAELGAIVDDPTHREAMALAAAALGRRDAAERVAGLLEEHAR